MSRTSTTSLPAGNPPSTMFSTGVRREPSSGDTGGDMPRDPAAGWEKSQEVGNALVDVAPSGWRRIDSRHRCACSTSQIGTHLVTIVGEHRCDFWRFGRIVGRYAWRLSASAEPNRLAVGDIGEEIADGVSWRSPSRPSHSHTRHPVSRSAARTAGLCHAHSSPRAAHTRNQ